MNYPCCEVQSRRSIECGAAARRTLLFPLRRWYPPACRPACQLPRPLTSSTTLFPSPLQSVTLHTTLGDIKIEVAADLVPRAAENFLAHCASGTYTGTKFHRNIPGFMVQGGDPTGTGKGGESVYGGFMADQVVEGLRHNGRGVVSFANNGPNTNGSQFFITYTKTPHLDGLYTIVGRVIWGLQVLDRMEAVEVGKKHRPLTDIVIEKVTVHANPLADLA